MNDKPLRRLLHCLADGQVHSGESLGLQLGISRAAVWKQIKQAQVLGLPVQARKSLGYQLSAAMQWLDAEDIASHLDPPVLATLSPIEILYQVESTNDEVLRRLRAGVEVPFVILAERQSAGRGRRGRHWYSPFGRSIYMTLGWRYLRGLAVLEGLSLVVGLMLLRCLQKLGATDLALKWPNDLMWKEQKLAGILIDVQGDPAGECQVAIGVGLNVDVPVLPDDIQQKGIEQSWVDLRSVMQSRQLPLPGRNLLVAELLNELVPALLQIEEAGFAAYRDEWQVHDFCFGKNLQVSRGSGWSSGRGMGVSAQGAYCIETPEGIRAVSGGEISIRRQKGNN